MSSPPPTSAPERSSGVGPLIRRVVLLVTMLAVLLAWLDSFQEQGPLTEGRALGKVHATLGDGSSFDLAEHRDEVVVLSFWATWCIPCRQEARVLNRLQREGVDVVGLAIDDLPLETVRDKAKEIGMDYPVGKGQDRLAERLDIRVVPTTCVIGRDGKLARALRGAAGYDELHDAVAAAKRAGPASGARD